jgi:hypothetical protein
MFNFVSEDKIINKSHSYKQIVIQQGAFVN